jgi:hypothetical protein
MFMYLGAWGQILCGGNGSVFAGAKGVQDAINAAYAGDNGNVGDGGDSAVRLFCFDVKMHVRLEMHEHFLKKLCMDQEGAITSKCVVPLWQGC